eukprot:COSAG01_NODE_962_length_12418_cov_57.124492_12_plen_170_part_00
MKTTWTASSSSAKSFSPCSQCGSAACSCEQHVPTTHAPSEHHQQTYKYLSVLDTCYCIPPLACQPTKSAQIQGGMRTAVRMKSLSGAGKLLRGFCAALPPAPTKLVCSVSITASKQPGEMLRSLEPVPPRASAYAAACAASYSAEDSQSSTSEVCLLILHGRNQLLSGP